MTDLRQAATLALKALEGIHRVTEYPKIQPAVTALLKALEQPQQEPVAWIFTPNTDLLWPAEVEAKNPIELNSYQPLYTTPPAAQSEQVVDCPRCGHVCSQRPWVGLTEEEIGKAWSVADGEHNASASVKRRITGAIEAKLKERNT
jgi:hypothetical protein